jgi:hypothetical protein
MSDAVFYYVAVIFLVVAMGFAIYVVITSIKQQKMFKVQTVVTGQVFYHAEEYSNPVRVDKVIRFGKKFIVGGETFNSSDFIQVRAGGYSMKRRGIVDGDIIYARKFDGNFTLNEIKEGDLLLIYLNDARYKGYKIRIFRKYADNNEIETYYYNKDGTERNSSHAHSSDRVAGVIKYKIENIYSPVKKY